jgi:hypothetical protein
LSAAALLSDFAVWIGAEQMNVLGVKDGPKSNWTRSMMSGLPRMTSPPRLDGT